MAVHKLSNGITLSYHDSGSGAPIVFLHSFGHNKNLWFPQLTHFLERGFRVLAPDMPGHGDSSHGYIALRMWARGPDLISGMVLSNTKAEKDSDEIVARRRAQIANIHKGGLEHFVTTGAPKRLSPVTLERRPWVFDIILQSAGLMWSRAFTGKASS